MTPVGKLSCCSSQRAAQMTMQYIMKNMKLKNVKKYELATQDPANQKQKKCYLQCDQGKAQQDVFYCRWRPQSESRVCQNRFQ